MQKNNHLLGAVLADVPPRVKCYLNARMAVTELLPPLLEIIAPNLRPVSFVIVCLAHEVCCDVSIMNHNSGL